MQLELEFSSQEFVPKVFQTEFAVCHAFDRKAAFWLKSNLQRSSKFWHLENRTEKKIWQNSFKNLLQKLFKLNLQCSLIERETIFWLNANVKTLIWHLENGKDKKFYTVDLRHWFEALQIKLSVRHTSETEVTFWLKTFTHK